MLSEIATEAVVILLLLLLNGLFSMSELAIMTARRTRLEHRVEESQDAGARAALQLAANPTAFLSTVQIGITLVGVLAGAFGGAGIAEVLAAQLRGVPWLAAYATSIAFAVVVSVITFLSLIIGERVPKNIALGNPERVASAVARPMAVLSRLGGPVVRLLTRTTNVVLRLLGLGTVSEPGVTEQDIRSLVEQGAESGVVEATEHVIVENTFRLGDRTVESIMSPRPDVLWVDLADPPAAIREQLGGAVRERFLVCDGGLDEVVGIVFAEDLLARAVAGEPVLDAASLRAVARAPQFVPAMMPVFRLLATLRDSRAHAAVVLDEYGAVTGLVTVHDLLEALVGDVPDGSGGEEAEMVREADGSWRVDAGVLLEEVETRLDLDANADERAEVLTIGGFVMGRLGRVPREGDTVEWAGRRVTVARMRGRRILSVVIAPVRDSPGVRGEVLPR
jgi:putative hemolysin